MLRFRLLVFAALSILAALAPPQTVRADVEDAPPLPAPVERVRVAQFGDGFVELINGRMVIHLSGSPYEMGYQHGRMLPDRVRQCAEAYVLELAIGRRGHTMAELLGYWRAGEPRLPESLKEELRGLAEGSGVSLELLQAAHALPARYHCSGAAVWGQQTPDGKLYHYRSLDYSLDIGGEVKVQENAALILRKPEGKVASCVVGWVGGVGAVTGMNAAGISIGEMGSRSSAERFDGFQMFFLLRYVLDESQTLENALAIFERARRTSGYNFIVADGRPPQPRAVAIECDRDRMVIFEGGDERENVEPHSAIPDAVRRVNHFVDPELAGRQRDPYDPRESATASWTGYELITQAIAERSGRLTHEDLIGICQAYPPTAACLHQAVMCPSDGRLWVSHAVDPDDTALAGAQNQPFHAYNLHELLATDPADLPAGLLPDPRAPATTAEPDVATGRCETTPLGGDTPDDPALATMWQRYIDAAPRGDRPFAWRLETVSEQSVVTEQRLSFPSAVRWGPTANRTVYAEIYEPTDPVGGPLHTVVLLHHLKDDQRVERIVAGTLAGQGYRAVLLYLPLYGPRSGDADDRGLDVMLELDNADGRAVPTGVAQAVWDVHRMRDWLRSRDDTADVTLLGISFGAMVGTLSAGIDPGFDGYALVLAGADLAAIAFNGSREVRAVREHAAALGLDEAALREKLVPMEPLTWAPRARAHGARTLMLNITGDDVIPRAATETLHRALGEPPIHWYPARDHDHIAIYARDALTKIQAFITGDTGD